MLPLHRPLHRSAPMHLGDSFGLARLRPACRRSERSPSAGGACERFFCPWQCPSSHPRVLKPTCVPSSGGCASREPPRLSYLRVLVTPAASDASAPGVEEVANKRTSDSCGDPSPALQRGDSLRRTP